MNGLRFDENSAATSQNRDPITIADVTKCLVVGLAVLVGWSFLSFDHAHAHIYRTDTNHSTNETAFSNDCEKPENHESPVRDQLEALKKPTNREHRNRPIVDRLQAERNLRQAMYDQEGTHEVLLENTLQKAMVIKPEFAQIRTTITPRQLREIINTYRGQVLLTVDDDPELNRLEREFAYKLRTNFGIGIAGRNVPTKVDTVRPPVSLRHALEELEVTRTKRIRRTGHGADSNTKIWTPELFEGWNR